MADNQAAGGKKPPAPPAMSRIPTFVGSKIPSAGNTTPVSSTPPAASPALSPLASPRSGPSPSTSSNNLMGRNQFTFTTPTHPTYTSPGHDSTSGIAGPQLRPAGSVGPMFPNHTFNGPPPLLSCDSPVSSPISPQQYQEPVEWDGILVAVRVRPLSDKERGKNEREVWNAEENFVIGNAVPHARAPVRYQYDTVFGPGSGNEQVYNTIARNMIPVVLNGFNATVFAYGVTSSGKTHTIMGSTGDPGITPRVIRDIFTNIENMPGKQFLMRMSIMEIYNEVINDLLDVTRVNLKIREDSQKQVQVEGLTEEVVVNAEQALALIAMGDANRKVSATAFNEDSSRSHTICRMAIESADKSQTGKSCLSYINIIDLAGSESAKAAKNVGHRLEGSYINKSLLTLGTVIHKLAETRNDQHIPFRDSKLTRLLQGSLSGTGAKVAIVCNITPSSGQMDETHNTLKFASRAKMIRIQVSKNEIVDAQSMIKRLQAEIAVLRDQLNKSQAVNLQAVNVHASAPAVMYSPGRDSVLDRARMEVEMHTRLLEERQKQDAERATLETRLQRLMGLVLSSSKALAAHAASPAVLNGSRPRHSLQRSYSAECAMDIYGALSPPAVANRRTTFHTGPFNLERPAPHSTTDADSDLMPSVLNLRNPAWGLGGEASPPKAGLQGASSDPITPPRATTSGQYSVSPIPLHVFGAGDLHVGKAAALMSAPEVDLEKQLLKEQLQVLTNEFEEKHKEVEKLKNAGLNTGSSSNDVELQVMYADREMLQDQLCATEITNEKLMRELEDSNSEIQKLQRRVDQLEVANQKLREQTPQDGSASVADEKLQEENKQLRAELERLQQQLAPTQSESIQTTPSLQNRLSLGVWQSRRTMSEDRESEEDVLGHLQLLEQEISEKLAELAKRDAQVKMVVAERDSRAQESEQRAKEVADLRVQLEEAVQRLHAKDGHIAQLQQSAPVSQDTDTLQQQLADKEAAVQKLQEAAEQLRADKHSELQQVQAERESEKRKQQEALQKLQVQWAAEVKQLQEALEKAKAKMAEEVKRAKAQDSEIEKLRETVRKMEQKEVLQEQMESFKRKMEARSRRSSADGSLSYCPADKSSAKVAQELQAEVALLRASNSRLHGSELEQLSAEELVSLISSLTQAVGKVSIAVQARRNNPNAPLISNIPPALPPTPPPQSNYSSIPSPPPLHPSA